MTDSLFGFACLAVLFQYIESISLLPLSSDISAINRRADEFKDLDEPIAHNFSDILLVTMNCLYKLHQALKESSYGGEARQSVSSPSISVSASRSTFLKPAC